MSERELADLIASYRKKQQRIMKQQKNERAKLDEKLQVRLEARKQKQQVRLTQLRILITIFKLIFTKTCYNTTKSLKVLLEFDVYKPDY